ncbi:uncharacterized protein LOC114306510 [Camellia sinensis]|uniref:uncharacterized protein LOC114306510 n=1 Tax=Camellia sinensis TaxID=4442 RepID=UPI001036DCCE|nr:uncharacterized protein LOC114306510 [Camellia sinensis]
MWTINDFPAYGSLSGWSTKGYLACPNCNIDASSQSLRSKIGYMGARRYLPENHNWHRSKLFNGEIENRSKPVELSGEQILQQINLGTIDGKNKDTDKARLDLEDMQIRKELHLIRHANGSFQKPPALYTLSPAEQIGFYDFLQSVKYPDGYAANVSNCVTAKGGKLVGLKSHDCHLCSKTLRVTDLEKLQEQIILILCKLEKIFPPAFFDVMVHLAIHLPYEARLGGPVQYRWMYPIERMLSLLKGFVGNKARPEGSIAEAYISKECTSMNQLQNENSPKATDEMWSLANGPNALTNTCLGCICNGVQFHTIDRDNRRKCQNSGLVVKGDHEDQLIKFYGYLCKVWELTYLFGHRVVLFQCEWYNTGSSRTLRVEPHVTTVDIRSRWYKDDSFVFPSQVQHVFNVPDTKLRPNWRVVEKFQHRRIWDVPELDMPEFDEVLQDDENSTIVPTEPIDDVVVLRRDDIVPQIISMEVSQSNKRVQPEGVMDDAFICDDDDELTISGDDEEDEMENDFDTDTDLEF